MSSLWPGYPHVLSSTQFAKNWYEKELFPEADRMRSVVSTRESNALSGKIIDHLFYEPSTRTRKSFMLATHLLGGFPLFAGDPKMFSSEVKGESFEDTIRIDSVYPVDAIIIRHEEADAPERATVVTKVPIISAGAGPREHPTQAMLDLYTIHKALGDISGLSIALVGDLQFSRTIRSLGLALPGFAPSKVFFIGPPEWKIPQQVKEGFESAGIPYEEGCDLRRCASELDVVYLTRAQTERSSSELVARLRNPVEHCYVLNDEVLSCLPERAKVMHPLPRNNVFGELTEKFTDDPHVIIFDQARNGLLVRMALLKMILS